MWYLDVRNESINYGIPTSVDVDLRDFTSFKIGGKANIFFSPNSIIQFQKCLQICCKYKITPKLLGGGSNLLITQNIPIVISTRNLRSHSISNCFITADSGASLPRIVYQAISQGLSIESLAGIPGTVGGAVYGNSGTKFAGKTFCIGDYIENVTVISKCGLKITTYNKSDLHFRYRWSSLQSYFILNAKLKLQRDCSTKLLVRWKNLMQQKQKSQPYEKRSAGCIFRNPKIKPAWQLIREVGLEKYRLGDIAISSQHANFIINCGSGSASDVLKTIAVIQKRIYQEFGLDLVLELQIW